MVYCNVMASTIKECEICLANVARYVCPRCNIEYCSVECYRAKDHDQCSESFYRNGFIESAKNRICDPNRMNEILQRLHEEQSDVNSDSEIDSDDEIDIEERLKNVNLNDADEVWTKLTESEKHEFESLLKNGDIHQIVPLQRMWWHVYMNRPLIQETESNSNQTCPKLWQNVPEFKNISKSKPHEFVKNNLLNIVAAYLFTVQYFNGDHYESLDESLTVLLHLSITLKSNHVFSDNEEAVKSVIQQANNCEYVTLSKENEKCLINDLKSIYDNERDKKYIIMSVLSDMCFMSKRMLGDLKKIQDTFKTKNSEFSKRFPNSKIQTRVNLSKKQLLQLIKKIEYNLAYVNEFSL